MGSLVSDRSRNRQSQQPTYKQGDGGQGHDQCRISGLEHGNHQWRRGDAAKRSQRDRHTHYRTGMAAVASPLSSRLARLDVLLSLF